MKHLITLVLLIAACACSRVLPEKDAIYTCENFEVYTDSIVRNGKSFRALSTDEITHSWKSSGLKPEDMFYNSRQMLVNALFAKAIEEADDAFTPTEIYLSLAAIDPEKSMETLRLAVTDGAIHRHDFPLVTANWAWAQAAWEIYCVTGNNDWLKEAFDIIAETLRREEPIIADPSTGLIHGVPDYYTPISDFYPAWMGPIDTFQTLSLGINATYSRTYAIAAEMAHLLGDKRETTYKKKSATIREAINDRLWIPNLGYYGQYLYGNLYPILSHSSDNTGNYLSLLFDITTPEMGESIISKCPVLPEGAPMCYPPVNIAHTTLSPLPQALMCLAAAKVKNNAAIRTSLGALFNLAIDKEASPETLAVILKVLLGMEFTTEGIHFSPIVPIQFNGTKSLHKFHYRDAILSVTVNGTGDKVAAFAIDSVSTSSHLFPADMKGQHHVTITLSNNDLKPSRTGLSADNPVSMPPLPKIYWADDTHANILNFDPLYSYGVYVNGTFLEEITTSAYTLIPQGTTVVDIVPIASQQYFGLSPRSHVFAPEGTRIDIPATSITPRRPPLHLIKHRETASKYIELAPRHNTRLTFYANVPEEGEYFINIGYSNGSQTTALRQLSVNGDDCGIFVCPAVRHNDWLRVFDSNTLTVRLNAGPNQLALTYLQSSTILLNHITLLKKSDSR